MSQNPAEKRNIRDEIVERRRQRILAEGYAFDAELPSDRIALTANFCADPLVICEIKRRSPSRGNIAPAMDPVAQAGLYRAAGIRSVSVLTEEDHFGGSLNDLMAVKRAYPDLAVLRKDFLIDEEDIRVAHRAGADAVLLIASMLDAKQLSAMHQTAIELGMSALVEVHNAAEIDKVRALRPPLMGINCRNLENFKIDRLMPLGLRPLIDWPAKVVFESGIFSHEDAQYTRRHGFGGILVGEAVVRQPQIIPDLIRGVINQESGGSEAQGLWSKPRFWQGLATKILQRRLDGSTVPLVKVCGITRAEDGEAAVRLGADILGFVFAPSPRRAQTDVVRQLAQLAVPKVAVVVDEIPAEVQELLEAGVLDAVQYSGDEAPEFCAANNWPYYKALRVADLSGLAGLEAWRCPRVLLDAWSPAAYGGTGKRLDPAVLQAAQAKTELWMAGGISASNIREIIREHRPELVDLSSSLESAPGIKDPAKLEAFFLALYDQGGTSA